MNSKKEQDAVAANRHSATIAPRDEGECKRTQRPAGPHGHRGTSRGTARAILCGALFLAGIGFLLVPFASEGAAPGREEIRVPGLNRPVEVVVDTWGVPHIFAAGEDDLFFAQGFNAARDRLFQLDLWRRRGLGRLSAAFGTAFVQQDRAARHFLYRGDIGAEWRAYSPANPQRIERTVRAFAAGINAYIDLVSADARRMPWEFKRFGYAPERWDAEDVVRIRSHGLTRNLLSEVARARTACAAGIDRDAVRLGLQPAWEPSVTKGLEACLPPDVLRLFELATAAPRLPSRHRAGLLAAPSPGFGEDTDAAALEGSNNWVIAPGKSATGRPIMANDPHRAYSSPSLRYIAHLSAPGLNVIGAGEPALPGISIGHNGTIAFGLTIFPIDQEDLYQYELDPEDPRRYRYGSGWEAFRTLKDSVPVKGGSPVEVELVFSRHGPVLFTDKESRRAWALRSCWLEPGMSPYFCSVESMRARNLAEFRNAMRHWGAPTLNHVYADVQGNIAWLARGMAPKRPNWDGLLPAPGDGRYEWDGFWSGDDLPSVSNPPQGWFATANQMNIPESYPYRERKLGFEWANPSRFLRISEVLGAPAKVSLELSERLQNDVVSLPARRLTAMLDTLTPGDAKARAAIALLRSWDCRETPESGAAALFEVWLSRHLRPAFARAVLPPAAWKAVRTSDVQVLIDSLENPDRHFGPDAVARRDALLAATLSAAYTDMQTLQGSDAAGWQWGKLHHNLAQHAFSEAVDEATRARIDVGPLPKGGSDATPNQSGYRTTDFRQTNGPSFRIVVDVGNWDNSRAINHPGQSGNPESPHYRDLAPLWLKGEYFPLLYSRAAIEKSARTRIRLVPQPARRGPRE